ncbi:DnaJ-class molecular chaperone [Caulobacter ginsengisoli]|uniref:DnaJ-class molecular chaperone n=1 Tax=Caulobacter ginsengisoli TaxID=400775 RepID=A0ABU0INC1_9CAUL|nr:J domain-containing protein [Caulobacter ginsengisoli]MDQ0463511.1 DnaJ-class molecular chaperone [Caulobacter ginsengisoli]
MAQDPYQELGVSRGAGADDIRKAFRKLAKQHHPDTNPNNKVSEERFKRITAAFDILGDPEKKKKFDRGEIDADGREAHPGFGGGNPFQNGGFRSGAGRAGAHGAGPGPNPFQSGGAFEGMDLNDILGDMMGGRAGRGAGGGFGGGFSARGQDLRAHLDIDLEDAIKGAKKRIAFSDGRTIDINIPKGAQDHQTLRLKGQGAPGRAGPGDALIELSIRNHPLYRREGDTLIMDLPISAPDAILGGKVEAPTPDGPVTLTVPRGASSGQSLRLKGRGFIDAKGKRGDLLARLMIVLPDTIDPELEKFAESWRKDRPYSPRRR